MYHRIIPLENQTAFILPRQEPWRITRLLLSAHSGVGSRKPLSGSPRNRSSVTGKPPPVSFMAGTVVVFDFDRTIIDGDSDRWVITEMGLTQLFNELRPTMPWNSLMDRMMMELHSQGKTSSDIAECLRKAAIHPHIIAAIKSAHVLGCELRIISDANQFYIETILEHHDLLGYFSRISTNPTFIDEEKRLKIFPFHDLSSPHGCDLCPPNMCKGLVIDQIRASTSESWRKFIYLGDGNGDFCPTLKLAKGDHVMPRKNYPLWKRICSNQTLIKAKIHEWSNGEELEEILLHLINTKYTEETSHSNSTQLHSSGHKVQTKPEGEMDYTALGSGNNLGH
ncbi:Pyridoxal phosphate phosphatase-related [Parasponia andersonii]|uniref:Pyridoxal phosphate phosphatase-related n=1 Tax=Parasponia andersonii TaxID=3476 RepID=A0A2P5BNT1_PARAD|nr:Pyridoxal phosphate phosphatase-related [Parasponia andersonii]